MKHKITFKNIIAYIQGNIRYKLYYSKFNWLIRKHIREQIICRIKSMDKRCFEQGFCIACGCKTTHLQMADKSCDNLCYPRMLDKKKWEFLKKYKITIITNTNKIKRDIGNKNYIKWELKQNKFIKYE